MILYFEQIMPRELLYVRTLGIVIRKELIIKKSIMFLRGNKLTLTLKIQNIVSMV